MELTKAIEILKDYKMESTFEATPDFVGALALGIEAMKWFKHMQEDYPFSSTWTLPGETPPKPQPAIGVYAGDTEGP